MVNEGRVLLPRFADWLGEFEHEIIRFPAAEHDDQVDAFSLLGRMIGKIKGEFKDQEPHDPNATDIAPRARTFGETMTRASIARKGRSRLDRSVPGAPPTPIYEELNVA